MFATFSFSAILTYSFLGLFFENSEFEFLTKAWRHEKFMMISRMCSS